MNKLPSPVFSPKFCHSASTSHRSLHFEVLAPAGTCLSVEKPSSAAPPTLSPVPPAANRGPEVEDLLPWIGWVTA